MLLLLQIYHPYRDAWFDGPPLPCPRFATSAAYLHGCIYMLGGFDGRQYLSSVVRLDPREGIWHPVSPAPILPIRNSNLRLPTARWPCMSMVVSKLSMGWHGNIRARQARKVRC